MAHFKLTHIRFFKILILGILGILGVFSLLSSFTGCDRFVQSSRTKCAKQAQDAQQGGDYANAIRLYEAALDGTARTADVHLQMALIFEDKLNDPLSALYHFRRYLRMTNQSARKEEVRGYIKRIELTLATQLSDSGIMTKREASRLKNENLKLQEALAKLQNSGRMSGGIHGNTGSSNTLASQSGENIHQEEVKKKAQALDTAATISLPPGTRTYVVQSGDTLASIAKKFYHSTQRWKDIADANYNLLNGSSQVHRGQVLIIP